MSNPPFFCVPALGLNPKSELWLALSSAHLMGPCRSCVQFDLLSGVEYFEKTTGKPPQLTGVMKLPFEYSSYRPPKLIPQHRRQMRHTRNPNHPKYKKMTMSLLLMR